MDLQPRSEPELVVSTTNNAEFAAYSGGFFPGASRFTIGGATFTSNNVTNNVYYLPPQEEPSAFRTILLGDINLKKEFKEMRLNIRSGMVGRQSRGKGVRKVYRAELRRDPGPATVAMYQGDGAEEEWRKHLAKYQSVRHPNMMQLYGLVCTKGLCAMVFHDELIPFEEFFNRFKHSSILTTYIRGYCTTEWRDVIDYSQSIAPAQDYSIPQFWIRPSTGALCVDPFWVPEFKRHLWDSGLGVPHMENVSLDNPDAEAVVISNLELDTYHKLCTAPMRYRNITVSTQVPIELRRTIFYSDCHHGTLLRITQCLRLHCKIPFAWWRDGGNLGKDDATVFANSWTRYRSRRPLHLKLWASCGNGNDFAKFWLAQANHIFTQLHETSHFENYVFMDFIRFSLRCLPNTYNTHEPDGYLFVSPAEDFRIGSDSFQWPECPAYWSLDPSGATRLSTEDAKKLGFPVIHIETTLRRRSWDASVYEGLRQFHQGKDLDTDSQDVARHLGYPLFELSTAANTPFKLPCVEVGDEYKECNLQDDAFCDELGHYL